LSTTITKIGGLGQRKVLAPNDFRDLRDVESSLLGFQQYYERIATPFEWKFTKNDLNALLKRIAAIATPTWRSPPDPHRMDTSPNFRARPLRPAARLLVPDRAEQDDPNRLRPPLRSARLSTRCHWTYRAIS